MILSQSNLSTFIENGHIYRPNGDVPALDIASIGLHLGKKFLTYKQPDHPLELPTPIETMSIEEDQDGLISFPPQSCILAATDEFIDMPLDLMGFIQTKGTIARGFVTVHLCDGQIDPGFKGNITLELVNLSSIHYKLKPGTPIAQLFIHKLLSPLETGYAGRYQSAIGPTSMRRSIST